MEKPTKEFHRSPEWHRRNAIEVASRPVSKPKPRALTTEEINELGRKIRERRECAMIRGPQGR